MFRTRINTIYQHYMSAAAITCDLPSKSPHGGKAVSTFSDPDRATCIQHVEGVAALEQHVVGWHWQALRQHAARLQEGDGSSELRSWGV